MLGSLSWALAFFSQFRGNTLTQTQQLDLIYCEKQYHGGGGGTSKIALIYTRNSYETLSATSYAKMREYIFFFGNSATAAFCS